MGKIWKALCAIGGGLSIGSVAYAAALGYDITNMQLWSVGVSTFFEAPTSIIEQALGQGSEAGVFQAIAMLSMGLVMLLAGMVVWSLSALRPSFRFRTKKDSTTAMRISDRAPAKSTKQESVEDDSFSDSKTQPTNEQASVTTRIKAALKERAKRDAFDSELESAEPQGWGSKMGSLFARKGKQDTSGDAAYERPENKAAQAMIADAPGGVDEEEHRAAPASMVLQKRGTKKKTARLTMKEKSSAGGWAVALAATVSTIMDRVASKFPSKAKAIGGVAEQAYIRSSKNPTEVARAALHEAIKEWFAAVQGGSVSQHVLVQKAAEFARALDAKERDAFTEIHSIDGAFILRLIDSWSTRTDVVIDVDEGADTRSDERQALRAAIRAVHMEKAGLSSIDDSHLPAEFTRNVDTESAPAWDVDEVGGDGIHDDLGQGVHEVYTEEGDAQEESESSKARMQASLVALAEEMSALYATIARCLAGETEWPDHLLYEEDRDEEIERLYDKWASVSFAMNDEDFERIASEEGSEALDWIVRETSIPTSGFKVFMRERIAEMVAQARGDEVTAEPTWSDDDIADTSTPSSSVDIPFEDEEDEDRASVGTVDTSQVDEEESAEASIMDEAKGHDDGEKPADEKEDDSAPQIEADESPDEAATLDIQVSEPVAEQSNSNEESDEVRPSVHVPASLELSDEVEIAEAETAVTEWGKVLQDCGAATGAIMKFTFQRNGVKVRPLGTIHVAAIWKGRPGIGRVNVVFRTLPAGTWRPDPLVPGRFLNETEDWVSVRETLFESTDFANALLMIHIRGEGAFDESMPLPPSWGKTIHVVKDIPEKDAIVALMDAAS